MDREIASLLVRFQEACVDEGIGPKSAGTDAIDREIMQSAIKLALAYGDMSVHTAWDIMLITDEHHREFCKPDCSYRGV